MYVSLIILIGPPGSGKTSLGREIASRFNNVMFVSVGEYMRGEMGLKPPFLDLDHEKVFSEILEKKFKTENKDHLIIDCNPFPPKMWIGVSKYFKYFKSVKIFKINAKLETLLLRLNKRNRNDQSKFSNENRLNYFFTNVDPMMEKINLDSEIDYLENENVEDFNKCIELISATYE